MLSKMPEDSLYEHGKDNLLLNKLMYKTDTNSQIWLCNRRSHVSPERAEVHELELHVRGTHIVHPSEFAMLTILRIDIFKTIEDKQGNLPALLTPS